MAVQTNALKAGVAQYVNVGLKATENAVKQDAL